MTSGSPSRACANWLRQADAQDGIRPAASSAPVGMRFASSKRRNRLLEQENEVLRRAAAYLSQANLRLGQTPK